MSKKETRRAAREAFPKAKVPAPRTATKTGGRTGSRPSTRPPSGKYSSKSQKVKAKTTSRSQGLKPPSWRRAFIFAALLAIAYFVMIQYLWVPKDENGNPTSTIWGSLLIAVIGFVAFTLIVYFTDKFTYNRRLRKLKGGSGQHLQK
jgi:hypothetical protein